RRLEDHSNGHDHVPGFPAPSWLVGINSPRHPQKSRNVHEIESEMETDHEEPEMPLAQGLAEHPSRHFGVPIIEGSEKGEKDSAHNHIMEVSYDEIREAELPVKGCCSLYDSRQAGNEELEQKREAKQHRCGIADLATPHSTQPVEYLDPSRDSDRHR